MPNKKLTYDEVMKVLLCCITSDCTGCPLKRPYCSELVALEYIRDFINRKQEEKQNLEIELKAMRGAANSYKAEIERLKRSNNISQHLLSNAYDSIERLDNFIENIKAEAYEKCIEKVKKELSLIRRECRNALDNDGVFAIDRARKKVNNILKELVGDGDGNL